MPTTRQQAQDAVYRYYQKTLRELPDGYALDNSRYGAVGAVVVSCDDNASDQNAAPAQYSDERVIIALPETNTGDLVAKVGDIWKNWGWRVETDRKGFNKPNRFAIAPDGFKLSVESDSQYPVVIRGASPCFAGDKERYEPIPIPALITRDGFDYGEPSESDVPEKPSSLYRW